MSTASALSDAALAGLQQQFTDHLPEMRRAIGYHLGRLARRDRDEFETDVLASAWHAWIGLARRGRNPMTVGLAGIITNAVRYVRNGRTLGTGTAKRGMDVYRAQKKARVQLVSIDEGAGRQRWRELLLSDDRVDPASQAAFKIDLNAWLATLSPRKREAALLLAEGYETGSAAKVMGVTAPAVSLARVALQESWMAFQSEASEPAATPRRARASKTQEPGRGSTTPRAARPIASAS